jgi:hypothetical protein
MKRLVERSSFVPCRRVRSTMSMAARPAKPCVSPRLAGLDHARTARLGAIVRGLRGLDRSAPRLCLAAKAAASR